MKKAGGRTNFNVYTKKKFMLGHGENPDIFMPQ